MARVISFTNHKGGVGKTTTAKNVAVTLARDNHRVLALDLDLQWNLSLAMVGENWTDLAESKNTSELFRIDGGKAIEDLIYKVEWAEENLHVILANSHRIFQLEHEIENMNITLQDEVWSRARRIRESTDIGAIHQVVEEITNIIESHKQHRKSWERILQKKLAPVQHLYDYIIIDLPPTVDKIPINAWVASQYLAVPISDFYATQGTAGLLEHLTDIYKNHNDSLKFLFFFNKVKTSKNQHSKKNGTYISKDYYSVMKDFYNAYSVNPFLKENAVLLSETISDSSEITKSARKYGATNIPNESEYAALVIELERTFASLENN
jgi:chromosome partitioning protein